MAFIWNNNPNIPAANLPQPTGPGEITTKTHVVANAVNIGGTLRYNTAPSVFDIIYELPSLNIENLNVSGNLTGPGVNAAARGAISAVTPISYNSNTGVISHAVSGVSPGTYGSATQVAVIQVNDKGHITAVTNTSVISAGAVTFPYWGPTNGQIGSGWATTQLALQTIIDNHRAGGLASAALQVHTLGQVPHANLFIIPGGTIANVNSGITIVAANTVGNTFDEQAGSVVLPDGRVYCLGPQSKIYDPISDTISPAAGSFPTGYTVIGTIWVGMTVLLNDGRVFCIPFNPTWVYTARVYDSKTDSLFTSTSSWFPLFAPNTWGFAGGVLMGDGRAYCVPLTLGTGGANTQAKIYDAANDIVTTANGTYPPVGGSQNGYRGAVLLPSGNVFVVPFEANTALIYNPVANTLTTANGTYKATEGSPAGFWGGVLLKDGRVFCVPHSSTTARIYDPVSDTLITPSGTYPGASSFAGGVLLPDGRVYMIPLVSTTARIYDPITDTLITPPGSIGGFAAGWSGGLLLPDGRIFWSPKNGNPAILVSTGFERLPKAFVTSPFWNRS